MIDVDGIISASRYATSNDGPFFLMIALMAAVRDLEFAKIAVSAT